MNEPAITFNNMKTVGMYSHQTQEGRFTEQTGLLEPCKSEPKKDCTQTKWRERERRLLSLTGRTETFGARDKEGARSRNICCHKVSIC